MTKLLIAQAAAIQAPRLHSEEPGIGKGTAYDALHYIPFIQPKSCSHAVLSAHFYQCVSHMAVRLVFSCQALRQRHANADRKEGAESTIQSVASLDLVADNFYRKLTDTVGTLITPDLYR